MGTLQRTSYMNPPLCVPFDISPLAFGGGVVSAASLSNTDGILADVETDSFATLFTLLLRATLLIDFPEEDSPRRRFVCESSLAATLACVEAVQMIML